jgi:hypothetical protein
MQVIIPVTGVCGSPSLITSTVLGIAELPVFLIIVAINCSAVLLCVFCKFCPETNVELIMISNIEKMMDNAFI